MFGAYVDGDFHPGMVEVTDEDGEVEREATSFRDRLGTDRHPVEPGRYHLYVSDACPWAHRTLITRALLGLRETVSVSVLDPFREEMGWQFTPTKDGCTADPVLGADYLHELYGAADPEYTGHVTVPVLWDRERATVVNNESREIMATLNEAYADSAGVDLYPDDRREAVESVLDDLYEPINNGVYRAGFADSQAAYDAAVDRLFDALDHWDAVLAGQRYLVGDRLTAADVAMYTTLVRFDNVYHTHFKCNRRAVREYDHLWPYLRDLYQTTGFGETTRMDHVTEHYYRTHPNVNPSRVVAVGPDLDFEADHDRDRLPGAPPTTPA
jgi:putative glutathione S-transferase